MDAELSALLAEVRADANRYNERFGRPKLTLIKGGKLTQAEEWQIQLLVAEWLGLQELKRLRGEK